MHPFKSLASKAFRTLALIAVIAVCKPAQAQSDEWTKGDTYREAAVVATSVVDWAQTLNIHDQYEKGAPCWEQNPMLGTHPSRAKINVYFLTSIGLHYVIARMLPRHWREGYQYLSIGWELGMDLHNAHLGFKVVF